MNKGLNRKSNIVLIGMPTSGKTTISKIVAEKTGYNLIEMDDELVKIFGTSIREVFDTKGEDYFRNQETLLAKNLKDIQHSIISCGGGIIKREENMRYLHENGIVVWLDRSVDKLYGSSSRPLSQTKEAITKLYEERKELYSQYSDVRVENNEKLDDTVNRVIALMSA